MVVKNGDSPWFVSVKKSTPQKNPRYWRVFHLTFIHGLSRLKRKQLQSLAMSNVCYFFVANLKDRKDPPMVSGEWTCMTQGCFDPQNDASFEGPMTLREVNQLKVPKSTSCSSIIQTSLFGIFISYLLFLRLFQRFWVFMWFVSTFSWLTPYEWGTLLLLPFLASTCQLLWLITLEPVSYQTASTRNTIIPRFLECLAAMRVRRIQTLPYATGSWPISLQNCRIAREKIRLKLSNERNQTATWFWEHHKM